MPSVRKSNSRGPNVKPTRKAVASYYELLKSKADSGDINAAAKLIELDMLAKQHQSKGVDLNG